MLVGRWRCSRYWDYDWHCADCIATLGSKSAADFVSVANMQPVWKNINNGAFPERLRRAS